MNERDGLNSGTGPNYRGASGGRGLPYRTHAIHVVLYRATTALTVTEINEQLAGWGYDPRTQEKTPEHLGTLCRGDRGIVAVECVSSNMYRLTQEARNLMANGAFSPALT